MSSEEAFARVEENEPYLVQTLIDLININTCVPPGDNYGALVEFLEPAFQRCGLETERVTVPEEKLKQIRLPLSGERINLVARRRVGKEPVSIYAHMDTVPVEDGWDYDPFKGTVEDGVLYGRGACDMKGSIACLLTALRVMDDLNLDPKFDLNCLMCTDEEIGIYPGVYHLALEGYVEGHVLCLELGAQEPIIVQGCAGDMVVTVTTKGKSCHSGMNFLGVNAVEEMVPILNELMELKQVVEKRESQISSFPLPDVPSPQMTPMFNLSILHGGVKENVIPPVCELVVNRRYIAEEKYEDALEEIKQAVERGRARSKALDISIEASHLYMPLIIDVESKYMKKMKEARKAVHGYEDYIVGGIAGSTDMSFVAHVLSTSNFVGTSPIRASNLSAHAANENVRVEDLISMTKELVHYLAF